MKIKSTKLTKMVSLKWKQYYLSLQSWHSQNTYYVWILRSRWVRYLKIDQSSQLVLLLLAKVFIAGNSNIINILRMSTLKRQIVLIPFGYPSILVPQGLENCRPSNFEHLRYMNFSFIMHLPYFKALISHLALSSGQLHGSTFRVC